MASFIVRDMNPQYGGQCYFVGHREVRDPRGRKCAAADFGDKEHAKRFTSRSDAESLVNNLNKMAGHKQFVAEEVSIYAQTYGQRRTNGFSGFGRLPRQEEEPALHGGFNWMEEGGYNGF